MLGPGGESSSLTIKRGSQPTRPLRLLFVATNLPMPDQYGGDLRLFALVCRLARKHLVTFYPYSELGSPADAARYRSMLTEDGVQVRPPGWLPGLERVLLEQTFDAVVFEFWHNAELGAGLVDRYQPWARTIVDTVDIHFRREEAALKLGISDAATVEANKRRELATCEKAHAVICVSVEDGGILESESKIGRWFVIPLIVPFRDRSVRERGPELLFLGGFGFPPNRDGILWFANEVWPQIHASRPDASLTVVGSNVTAEVAALSERAGIEVVGYVPDVAPYFDRAAMMVAPLLYGAGVKTKVVEAMAASLPVVTTPVGAQGLEVVSGEHLMIADDGETFARHVVDLLGEPERAGRIGRAGREYVAATVSPEVIEARMGSVLDAVVDRGRPAVPPLGWVVRSAAAKARRARARLNLGRLFRKTAART